MGFYQCYIPESNVYKEHHAEYWFDGDDFRDGDTWKIFDSSQKNGRKITKHISHWMKIEKPI